MFIAALLTLARTWKQPRYPLTDKWIKTLWCVCVCVYIYVCVCVCVCVCVYIYMTSKLKMYSHA